MFLIVFVNLVVNAFESSEVFILQMSLSKIPVHLGKIKVAVMDSTMASTVQTLSVIRSIQGVETYHGLEYAMVVLRKGREPVETCFSPCIPILVHSGP